MPHVQPEALLERRRPSPMHRQWTRERLPMLRTAGRVPPGGLETPPPAAPPAARHGTTARWKIPGTTPEQAAGNRSPAFQPPGCRPRRHGDVGRANRQSAVVKGDLRVTRRGPGEDSGPSHLARHHDHGLRSLRRNVSQGVRTPACMAYRITLAKHSAGEGGRWGGRGYLVEQSRATVWPCAHKDLKSTPGLESFQPQALQRPTLTVVKGSSARVLRGATETIKYPVNHSTLRLESTLLPALPPKFSI